MASIQKRGGKYEYTVSRYVNGLPKPIRKGGFRTKQEARIAAAEIESQRNRGTLPHLDPIPFDEYFDQWVELYKANILPATKRHYHYTSKAIKEYFEGQPIQKISRQDYQQFLNQFGATRAKETVEKVNGHIRSCLKDAIEDKIISFDFTRKATLTWTVEAKTSQEKHLSLQDSQKLTQYLWEHIDESLSHALILMALNSGMRFAEIVGLTWDDLDFDHNTITVNKTWGYMKRNPTAFGKTKNVQSIRSIKMDNKIMSYFQVIKPAMPWNEHNLVFYSPTSQYKVLSNTGVNKLLRKILIEIDIQPIAFHGLRHTHASIALYNKASINFVSERLGHADIETTLKEYTHVIKELRKEDEDRTVAFFESMLE
ncbi:tyrosine-type recombinase/integrase [Salisediminibacterium halotolerans]|uniref:tyrosine-type recombinase/integrase n=1 Tax=Salisediminibacterium halotolerans TaxID=517425 RepID=UPI000EABF178|nr:tyrosine-type recombinase/integrase [Salisediminibacterium halotolerans]RLJ72184.1 site-specific recombinase XerD [Actinophytocola xinjiangensis]RPE85397.1 site-specific recombinase XerD [Salisediminibacterium halotolerans]TWG33354.1 site-specific recombinase XerD [Salisediminibacterium halotolerans]GEL07118.1 integrase [Salisediminibacterium halotolerans]